MRTYIGIMDKNEEWKDIEGYEGYQVSSLGRVRSKRCVLKQCVCKGYQTVAIKNKTLRVHRLVAITFLPNPLCKKEVDHIDGNPLNNCVDNLRWATRSENESNPITRKRISETLKGRKITWRDKISETISKNNRGSVHYRSKPISQFTIDGEYVADYANAYEASRMTGIDKQTIYCCLIGKFKRAGKYTWKYKNSES